MKSFSSLALFPLLPLALAACSGPSLTASKPPPAEDNTLQSQIVNGTISAVGSRPYQIKLDIATPDGQAGFLCGGTLISSTWVLTAAHCVMEDKWVSPASGVTAYAGRSKLEKGGQRVRVSQVIVHPKYDDNATGQGYDIALLKLSTAVTDPNAAPAAIPGDAAHAALMRGNGVVSGWGGTEDGRISDDLREISVPVFEGPVCGQQPIQICTDSKKDDKDAGSGDSGGPMAGKYNNKFYVFGIVSFGVGNDETSTGVYTRVNSFKNWIQQTTGVAPDSGTTGGNTPGTTVYKGTLAGSKASSHQPSGSGFAYGGGTLRGQLSATGPSGTDIDLYLEKRGGTGWEGVALSNSDTNTERISYAAERGTYRWRVYSYRGSGSYTLTETK